MVPFAEANGVDIEPFDFRVPGVTSISCDHHKYGLAPKGASVVMFRDRALRRFTYFTIQTWPGGLYGTLSHAGSRGASAIAGAWFAMLACGKKV